MGLALFFLSSVSGASIAPAATRASAEPPLRLAEAASPQVAFWESVRDSKDAAELEAYLKAYPDGQFAPLARIRLEKLKSSAQEAPSPQIPVTSRAESEENESAGDLGRHSITVKVGESAASKRGVLGVRVTALTEELASALGLTGAHGAFVTEVLSNTPAALAGIKPLDVVIEFDGRAVAKMRDLPQMVGATPPGTEARMVFWRFARSFQELADALRARAEKGDGAAANALGWLYAYGFEAGKNEAEAARWYHKAADQGHAEAMTRLASMYANGQGVNKDEAEAVSWYRKAADKNDSDAVLNLGIMYEKGRGVSRDEAEAVRLYRKAADQGNTSAMYNLGVLYANGRGVPRNDAEAVAWYRKAADGDVADAITNLAFMYEMGRGVSNDYAQAINLYQKAADLNESGAMNQLGNMYADGRGVPKDDAAAVTWYRRGADLGHADAMASLGWMYQNGRGVAQSDPEAFRWYRSAAEKNQKGAMNQLGWMYTNGHGTAIDLGQAAMWYRKGAELGDSECMYSMANAYDHALGVAKDPSAAADWMLKSIRAHNAHAVQQMTTNAEAWSSEFRRKLQERMQQAGDYSGPIDGSFGAATASAVEALSKQ